MITILGATGNTGRRIAEQLLAKGEKVRAVVRSKDKAKDLAAKGAELVAGNFNAGADGLSDAKFLASAFKGADAVYTLIPPNAAAPDFAAYQDKIGIATATAAGEAAVKKVVFLSSIGGDLPGGNGPIAGLFRQEKRLRELGIDLLVLRPAYFMENLGGNLGMIKHQGINGGALQGGLKMPLIATQDIADYATKRLLARDWKGVEVAELLGPRDYSMDELTAILGAKVGKPDLKYVTFPYGDFAKALTGFGFSQSVADGYAEMSKAFNERTIKPVERTPAKTTPATFEAFADVLAKAYESA